MPKILLKSGMMSLRFNLYTKIAPATCRVFTSALPLSVKIVHARFAGEEIWGKGPKFDIPQENATIHLKPGELGYAVPRAGSGINQAISLVYGEAKLHDCVNVFAKVYPRDLLKLKSLGETVWLKGKRTIKFVKSS